MQVDSIKINQNKTISVSYTQITKDSIEGESEYFKFTVKTNRPANNRIYDIFGELKSHATKLLELPAKFKEKITVKGANFTMTKDNILGMTLNCERALDSTDTPNHMETPHHLIEKYDENNKQENIMDAELSELILELMQETTKYVSGYKDQIEMKLEFNQDDNQDE